MTPWATNKQPMALRGPILAQGWSAMRQEKLRIALYSHDTMGIGHMRRNQLIAEAFAASPVKPNILMICGAREACCFTLPAGVDCLTLPALAKRGDGMYYSRRLDVQLEELLKVRAEVLRSALRAFEPDLLIVDKVPRGALRELDPALDQLKHNGRTRFVLGLRDILDDPHIVAEEWTADDSEQAVRDYYDAVWVYGSRDVYDVSRRYCFSSDVAEKIRYTGYLQRYGQSSVPSVVEPPVCGEEADLPARLPEGRFVLCVVGGGQDGGHIAEAFAQAQFPPNTSGVIVTGPFMPPDVQRRVHALARSRQGRLRVIEFVPQIEPLLRRAERVVAMGGYNTVCELLALRKTALIVPRTRPRREQLIRAQNMHALGLLDYLEPERLCPESLSAWLQRDVQLTGDVLHRIDFNGLKRLPQMLGEVVAAPATLTCRQRGAMEHVA